MGYVWTMRHGAHRLLVEAGAKFTNIGLSSLQGGEPFASVVLMHDLTTLQLLTPCLLYMRERELQPELYVWNLDSAEPEFLVMFTIPMPDRHMLRKLVGKHLADLITEQSEDARFELTILTAGDGFKKETHQFLEAFKRKGCGAIIVAEASEKDDRYVQDTTMSFVITKVIERAPELVD